MALSCAGQSAIGVSRAYAAMRLFVNFFQPSFKLASKARDGALVRKRYHPPSDALSTVDGGPTDERGGAPPSARAAVHVGPSSPAEGDPCGPAADSGGSRPRIRDDV